MGTKGESLREAYYTPADSLEELQQELNAFIESENLTGRLSTELGPKGLLVTILDGILFDSGSAELRNDAHEIIVSISDMLASNPPRKIQISGHTDDQPIYSSSFQSNWDLSTVRALNVMNIFFRKR